MATSEQLPIILIVDDMPDNIGVLFDFLNENHFEILVARSGEDALELLGYSESLPDLILLDVMMPGIDGFETCVRIKSDCKLQEIPVIFMTALNDTLDKVKGLKLGAVDYITKPIQQDEVLARLNTHLTIRQLQKELQVKNRELAAQYELTLQLNETLQKRNEELQAQYTMTHQLNEQLQQEIEEKRKMELALEKANDELFFLGNFSTRS